MTDTKRLRELAEKATPGPWTHELQRLIGRGPYWAVYREHGTIVVQGDGDPRCEPDVAFIAAANPTAVLALLDDADMSEAWEAIARERHARVAVLEQQLDLMTAARDEACEIAERCAPLAIKDAPTANGSLTRKRISELRKVGS